MSERAKARAVRRLAGIALLWLVLGELVVPNLIGWLYSADPANWWAPLARALARAQSRHSLDYYLGAWRKDGRWAVFALFAYQGFALATRQGRFAERFVPPATPAALGAIRALVASVLLASTLWEHLPSSALLPRGLIHGEGPVLALLYALPIGFERFVASAPALALLQAATALLLACAALGFRTRVSVPLAAAAYLILGGVLRQYAWFYHTGLVPLYLLMALSFTPCGDGLSLDRWLRERRGESVPSANAATLRYGWPRFFLWVALAFPYVEAGLSKLRRGGFAWPHAENLKSILLIDTLNPMQFDWGVTLRLLSAPDALFWAIGVTTLLGDIGYGLVLFSRRARLVLPAITLGMHLGIWFLQNVLFFDLMLLQAILFGSRALPGSLAPASKEPVSREPNWPRRVRLLAALLITCWALRIEEYPFTAMQMYSKPNLTGEIDWIAVVATFESGELRRAPIGDAIPALRDARYRRVLRRGFERYEQALAKEFLTAFALAHNANAKPGSRITSVEAQLWRWNYSRAPNDPRHGALVERYGVQL